VAHKLFFYADIYIIYNEDSKTVSGYTGHWVLETDILKLNYNSTMLIAVQNNLLKKRRVQDKQWRRKNCAP